MAGIAAAARKRTEGRDPGMHGRGAWRRIAAATAAVAACAGCGSLGGDFSPDSLPGNATLDISATNPWRAEFTRAFEDSDDPFVRGVLADGQVSEEERAEARNRYFECLHRSGQEADFADEDAGNDIVFLDGLPDHLDLGAAADVCMRATGRAVIEPLFFLTRGNPNNEPGLELQCLQERGAVDPGLTAERFDRRIADWRYMKSLGKDFEECARDPKGGRP